VTRRIVTAALALLIAVGIGTGTASAEPQRPSYHQEDARAQYQKEEPRSRLTDRLNREEPEEPSDFSGWAAAALGATFLLGLALVG
jgi:cytochrome c-type biogenesis protein CcmH/NrfG